MSSETPEKQPVSILGRPVKPEHVQHLVKFYEADSRLTADDRKLMAEDITSARNTSVLWGMFDCTCALLAPTLYKKMADRNAKVPAGVRRPVFHRPFLSSIFATGVYFVSAYFHSKSEQQFRISRLETDSHNSSLSSEDRASRARMLDVWKALEPAQLTLFSFYYQETVRDPSHVMKDPRQMFSTDPHSVVYLPPPENKIGGSVSEKVAPHWEKIREENGFVRETKEREKENVTNDAENTEVEMTKDDSEPEKEPKSAWERLRKRN